MLPESAPPVPSKRSVAGCLPKGVATSRFQVPTRFIVRVSPCPYDVGGFSYSNSTRGGAARARVEVLDAVCVRSGLLANLRRVADEYDGRAAGRDVLVRYPAHVPARDFQNLV